MSDTESSVRNRVKNFKPIQFVSGNCIEQWSATFSTFGKDTSKERVVASGKGQDLRSLILKIDQEAMIWTGNQGFKVSRLWNSAKSDTF